MNRKSWKSLALVAMLAALMLCLSACSFIDNANIRIDWAGLRAGLIAYLNGATVEPESTPEPEKEVIVIKEIETEEPSCDYENYQNMSAEKQQKFIESFDSMEAFFVWLNDAQAEHEKHSNAIEVGSNTVIDMSELAK